MPDSSSKTPKSTVAPEAANVADAMDATDAAVPAGGAESSGADVVASDTPVPEEAAPTVAESAEPWPKATTCHIEAQDHVPRRPDAPKVSDSGWGGRQTKTGDATSSALEAPRSSVKRSKKHKPRTSEAKLVVVAEAEAEADVVADVVVAIARRILGRLRRMFPIESKSTRTEFHQKIRQLFQGKLETESGPAIDEGASIVIKWARGGRGRGGGGGSSSGSGRGGGRNTYPPYIHFSMQKTNRDTQDALGYLARTLHVNIRDLAVAGTKDKRGVTVQRVSLKRNNKTVEDVFKLANGISGRKSVEEALKKRGDRGVRITDFNYRKAGLELGMLKGNAFVITLRSAVPLLYAQLRHLPANARNAQVDSTETIDKAVSEPLLSNTRHWTSYSEGRVAKGNLFDLTQTAGEHPDVAAARDAWLVDGDLDKALEMMPRRVVAERCILESYKKQKGDTRNAMGALSTIPRNLRLMYVHAYQSYVWNAIVSERIRTYGPDKPVVGDLIMEATQETPDPDNMEVDDEERNDTAEAGTDVAYPGGELGEKYRQYLRLDGLDPDNFVRKQKEYTLFGSYRKILHLPKELTWTTLRYTDPDVPLAQADEDKLLGFDPPVVTPDGKFLALQIKLTLGTAAYATMALRESPRPTPARTRRSVLRKSPRTKSTKEPK
ncbi:tRNA uridine synthase [Salix suchowensis]|nr:tRNA uridine synthase [Salix suchowensis]